MREENNRMSESEESFLNIKKENSFLVPNNYFNELYENTMSEINVTDLKTINSFKTPNNYFEKLEEEILAQTNLSKLTALQENFETPENYFDKLSENILSKTVNQTSTNKTAKLFSLSFIKYAAAAVLLLATTFGIYNKIADSHSINKELAKIPDQDIIDYLQQYSDTNDLYMMVESSNNDVSGFEQKMIREFSN